MGHEFQQGWAGCSCSLRHQQCSLGSSRLPPGLGWAGGRGDHCPHTPIQVDSAGSLGSPGPVSQTEPGLPHGSAGVLGEERVRFKDLGGSESAFCEVAWKLPAGHLGHVALFKSH